MRLAQKFQAVIQDLFLTLCQYRQVKFSLDRLKLRDTIQKTLDRIQINSCTDPLEGIIALRIPERGNKIEVRD